MRSALSDVKRRVLATVASCPTQVCRWLSRAGARLPLGGQFFCGRLVATFGLRDR